jgi:hypothetical protein
MSEYIDNAFITQWSAEAHQAYQQMNSNLRNAVRVVSGVTGGTYKFPILGSGYAVNNKARHADLEPLNLSHDSATATLTTAHAPEYIDNLDAVRTNLNVRAEYTKAVMSAISREMDSRILTAMDGTSTTATAGNMDAAMIAGLHKKLTKLNVPLDSDRYLVVHSGALEDMLGDSKIASNDYLSKDAYSKGFVPGVLGFNVVICSDDLMPTHTSNKHTCFAFHKSAVGLAIGSDVSFSVKEVPQKDSWLVLAKMLSGACLIDTNGVVSVEIAD